MAMGIFLFFTFSVLNITLYALKTLVMARLRKTWLSALLTATSAVFYIVVVVFSTGYTYWISLPIIFVSNVLGVYASAWIMQGIEKDKLWKITVYTKNSCEYDFLINNLNKMDLDYIEYNTNEGEYMTDIFSYSQADSLLIKNFINKIQLSYHVTECGHRL